MESKEGSVPDLYSSSTSAERFKYDVFLSFRGSDTRSSFTDLLYTYLEDVRVRTFRDGNKSSEGEEIGEGLRKAIKESKISIPILSKNYASSNWCLRELAQMVECKKTTEQLILPIFYHVEPSEVQHQSGSYEEAFREYESCFDESTIKEWKEALREVGSLKGWEVEKETDGYQGKLIKEMIIPTVLLELKKYYVNVTDNLVGMDDHENKMMRLLNIGSDDVRVVGIHGVGGIGKTTIAKFMYDKPLKCFECRSFLADVRETVRQRNGFLSLQKQLLADTLERRPDITDVNSGIDMINRIFLRKKVLIVLDDVNESSQFAMLLGKHHQFGSGSRIIVTTRDKHVLNVLKVDAAYEPPFMNHEQSLQLLSVHAFRSIFPRKDYVSISKKVVSATFGLPLALEVIGSFLSHKEEDLWEDTLKKLKEIPDSEVQKKLSISYEALNYEQQQIFLDVACFFIGMDKTYVSYMWDGCDYNPEKEINVLCLMSLVKIGDDNLLRMHDQLRDLGREIICQESSKNPGKRSRLWNHEEALDILEGRRGTEKVEALSLQFDLRPEKKPRLTSKQFRELENLRYLQVDGTDLVGNFEHLIHKLRWLSWHSCPQQFKPTNFCLKNLVILNLSNSGITEDWGGWTQFKVANKLKVLQLANCALRRTPDFSSHATLEILILRRCKSLLEIDRSIGNLKNLRVLDSSYTDIRKLPDEIWMLKKLEMIDASSCYYLEEGIPSNIESLSSLRFLSFNSNKVQSLPSSIQTLDLVGCERLQSLPELPWNLKTLEVACIPSHTDIVNSQELRLIGDLEFVELPNGIGQLCNLKRLFLDSTNIRHLPEETFALPQLELLDVQFCHNLQLLPMLPSSLVNISLRCCSSLESLPDLSNLKNLEQLSLRNCSKLKKVRGLGNLESLRRFGLYACDMLVDLDFLEELPCLAPLEMSGTKDLELKPDLSNLKKLESLSIADCAELNKIQGLGTLNSLKRLYLHRCMNLHWIEDLETLKSLVVIEVSGCALNQHPEFSTSIGGEKSGVKATRGK